MQCTPLARRYRKPVISGEAGPGSGGETGRREGLKIPWDKIPCGFDPRPEHPLTLTLSPDPNMYFFRKPYTAENLAMHMCLVPDTAA